MGCWSTKKATDLLNAVDTLKSKVSLDGALPLIKLIEKATRAELGILSINFLSHPDFVNDLIRIGILYEQEEKILEEIVSALRMIAKRMRVYSDNLYDFFLRYINYENKRVHKSIVYELPFFPQFDQYEKKWDLILSIPKIAPKKNSIVVFRWVINKWMNQVPNNLKNTIIAIFEKHIINNNLHVDDHRRYTETIKQLQDTNSKI